MAEFFGAICAAFVELLGSLGSSTFFGTFMIVCCITIGFAIVYNVVTALL